MRRVGQHSEDKTDDVMEKAELVSPRESKPDHASREGNLECWRILVKLLVVGLVTASLVANQLMLKEDLEKNDAEEIEKASLGKNEALQNGVAKRVPWEEGKVNSQENIAWWEGNRIRSKQGRPYQHGGIGIISKRKKLHRGRASTVGAASHHRNSGKNIKKTRYFRPKPSSFAPIMFPKFDNHTCIKHDGDIDDAEEEWLSRAPRAILLGAMKSGTSALSQYIRQHPRFLDPKLNEMHFFDYNFDDYMTTEGILFKEAREEYSEWFRRDGLAETNSTVLALDNSPTYLLWSDRVPQQVMCVAPHAKLLIMLRDPIERIYSNYNHRTKNLSPRDVPSFEDWIRPDMEVLQQSGVLQDWNKIDFESFSGSQQEREAWNRYIRTQRKNDNCVGRSLYALQLQQWLDAMEEAGKPRSDLMIVRSELLKSKTDDQMSKIWKFLGVDDFTLPDHDYRNVGTYRAPIKNETRDELRKLFHPYNQRLYAMLGADWEGVWG